MNSARKRTRHLPHSRQRQLVARAQRGDTAARDMLVETNQSFVAMLAGHYQGRGVEHEELVQEGSLGLMRAIEKFDMSRPVNFMTYAAHWIRQAMGRACEQQGTLHRYGTRLPAHVTNAMSRISRATPVLERELGRAPTDEELAVKCEVSLDTVEMAQRMLNHSVSSIDAAVDGGDEEMPSLQIPDERPDALEELADIERSLTVTRMMAKLPDDQQQLLRRRFGFDGEPATERALTEEWGVNRAQLQSLRASALTALRSDEELDRLVEQPARRFAPQPVVQPELAPLAVPTCTHLREGVRLEQLPVTVFSQLSERSACGRYGSFWWLITDVDGRMQVQLTDGPDGEMFTLPEAIRCFSGEQAEEALAFARRLPLERRHCPACAAE